MVTLQALTGSKLTIHKDIPMNALAIPNNLISISEEAKTHMVILTELLRDIDLEGRMMTLIKAEEFIQGEEVNELQLESIRLDLEMELTKIRKMVFMVEKAQYYSLATQRTDAPSFKSPVSAFSSVLSQI